MSARLDQLMVHAGNVLRAAKKIDFERVVEHHEPAVDYLHQVLEVACGETERIKELGMLRDDPGSSRITSNTNNEFAQAFATVEERQRMNIELINDMGFANRIGKVFSSLQDREAISFEDVGKTTGLPHFDLVLTPDESPPNTIAGVFVDDQSVTLAVLKYPINGNVWHEKVSNTYRDPMEMLDLIKRFVTKGGIEVH